MLLNMRKNTLSLLVLVLTKFSFNSFTKKILFRKFFVSICKIINSLVENHTSPWHNIRGGYDELVQRRMQVYA